MRGSTFWRLLLWIGSLWLMGVVVLAAYVALQSLHPPVTAPAPQATPHANSTTEAINCHHSEPPAHSPYLAVARADAQNYHLDALTFVWQIWQESAFNPNVHNSPAGAIGIAQFMPDTARGMGIDPHDPRQALSAAARLDAGHLKQYARQAHQLAGHYSGNEARYAYGLALAAYNAGPGSLENAWRRAFSAGWPGSPWAWLAQMATETRAYVPAILGCALS
jgi:soluble lytic murein transglycosylase-like protein